MACVSQMNYNNKQLIGAMIVAGWDETDGGQVGARGVFAVTLSVCTACSKHQTVMQHVKMLHWLRYKYPGLSGQHTLPTCFVQHGSWHVYHCHHNVAA